MAADSWFTCTPVSFTGDERFFSRDSGLICKGFQQIGISCKAIMPLPAWPNDPDDDLIRTPYRNLEDPAWWKSLNGCGVVLYGWGAGKYAAIARAIKQAGMFVVTSLDTSGILGICNGIREYASCRWRVSHGETTSWISGTARFALNMANASTVGLIRNDYRRARHLGHADVIGVISPVAADRVRRVCRVYGGEKMARKVHVIPHPNPSYMRHDPAVPKEKLMVAIGRWNDQKVKGTALLMDVCSRVLTADQSICIEIYGNCTQSMSSWHDSLDTGKRGRIRLMGMVPNKTLAGVLQRARVSLCTSLRESYHTVSGEALCCGASVVGPDSPELPSFKWFSDGPFGSIAGYNADELCTAVIDEFAAWDAGERDPAAISKHWSSLLHAPHIARRIIELHQHTSKSL